MVRIADSRAKQSQFREIETLNQVRAEVAEAHARVASRYLQIEASENAVRAGMDAFKEDMIRIKGGQGFPLELIDSLRILCRARYEYLDSIITYNRAQFQLWVSLGRPPANALARPLPADLVPPLPSYCRESHTNVRSDPGSSVQSGSRFNQSATPPHSTEYHRDWVAFDDFRSLWNWIMLRRISEVWHHRASRRSVLEWFCRCDHTTNDVIIANKPRRSV